MIALSTNESDGVSCSVSQLLGTTQNRGSVTGAGPCYTNRRLPYLDILHLASILHWRIDVDGSDR